MLSRAEAVKSLEELLGQFPVVALIGARQVGKSTLARQLASRVKQATVFDLENGPDLARLDEPTLALGGLRGLVIIDEIQRRPDLFPALRVLADRPRCPARFLVLGSAAPALLRQSSETLAGRIATFELDGFNLGEVAPKKAEQLWLRGGFPKSFLAASDAQSLRWRQEFLDTFLARDIPALGFRLPSALLGRFWRMLAHSHGQIWNASEIGRSLGATDATVRHYLDVLASAFVVRVLAPFHENLGKRQVKSPKVYIADTGLLHALLGITDRRALDVHPRLVSPAASEGPSFTGITGDQGPTRWRGDGSSRCPLARGWRRASAATWRQRGAEGSFPDRLGVVRDCSACSLSRRG